MTHKTWPPPVGTLLILTDADRSGIHTWENGDVLVVTDNANEINPRATRLRDAGAKTYWVFKAHTRPVEETDNDQT